MPLERILVVEDERLVAEDLRDMLSHAGYDVVDAISTGEEAIERVGDLRPHLVLMDVHLGSGIDGITAARIIGERHGVPVVFLTAYSNSRTLDGASETGAFGFVLKPFHARAVIAAVEVALGRHRREQSRDRSEQFLRKGYMSLPVGVIMVDPAGTTVFANGLARLHVGRCLDAERKVPLSTVFDRGADPASGADGQSVERVGRIIEMSGKPLDVAYFEEPLSSSSGESLGSIIVYQDTVHPVIPGTLGHVLRGFMKTAGDEPLSPAQFITICAWSNKVRVSDERWVPFEEFLMHYLGLQVTHGMSPDVAKNWATSGS